MFEIQAGSIGYVDQLYLVYDIQEYLRQYASELMSLTLAEGSQEYKAKIPALILIPAVMAVVSVFITLFMLELSRIMKWTIVNPITRLVDAAKRIANNDFYIEDVPIENNDEVGELTHAFNKMKFRQAVEPLYEKYCGAYMEHVQQILDMRNSGEDIN